MGIKIGCTYQLVDGDDWNDLTVRIIGIRDGDDVTDRRVFVGILNDEFNHVALVDKNGNGHAIDMGLDDVSTVVETFEIEDTDSPIDGDNDSSDEDPDRSDDDDDDGSDDEDASEKLDDNPFVNDPPEIKKLLAAHRDYLLLIHKDIDYLRESTITEERFDELNEGLNEKIKRQRIRSGPGYRLFFVTWLMMFVLLLLYLNKQGML